MSATLNRAQKKELASDLSTAVGWWRVQSDTIAHYYAPAKEYGEHGDKHRQLAPCDLAAQMSGRDKGWIADMANDGMPPTRTRRRFRRWGIARLQGGFTAYGRSVAMALNICLHPGVRGEDNAVCPHCGRIYQPWGYWIPPRSNS